MLIRIYRGALFPLFISALMMEFIGRFNFIFGKRFINEDLYRRLKRRIVHIQGMRKVDFSSFHFYSFFNVLPSVYKSDYFCQIKNRGINLGFLLYRFGEEFAPIKRFRIGKPIPQEIMWKHPNNNWTGLRPIRWNTYKTWTGIIRRKSAG